MTGRERVHRRVGVAQGHERVADVLGPLDVGRDRDQAEALLRHGAVNLALECDDGNPKDRSRRSRPVSCRSPAIAEIEKAGVRCRSRLTVVEAVTQVTHNTAENDPPGPATESYAARPHHCFPNPSDAGVSRVEARVCPMQAGRRPVAQQAPPQQHSASLRVCHDSLVASYGYCHVR